MDYLKGNPFINRGLSSVHTHTDTHTHTHTHTYVCMGRKKEKKKNVEELESLMEMISKFLGFS